MSNMERWSRATEEIKFYDTQLLQIPQTLLFQDMLINKAPAITEERTQLFNPDQRLVKKRVSSRTVKV